ncbi:hypothetical protein BDQ17DRAFT_1416176 [Cyathus striatus]|nr:hypothetical protein BDQ17DRAFT_1416176 [Cyathus striatus]
MSHIDVGNIAVPPRQLRRNDFTDYRLGVPSDYNFKCAGHEGAILILPEGSYRQDLRAIGAFQNYASKNGVCWYRYANRVRGRAAVKSRAWALGAFAHSSSSSPGSVDLRFHATTVHHGTSNYTYHWTQSGPTQFKYGSMTASEVPNQSLFIRTFCIELNHSKWWALLASKPRVIVRKNMSLKVHEIIPQLGEEFLISKGSMKPLSVRKTKAASFKIPSTTHPSRLITQYLLQKVPTANLAIAHHDDWKVLMEEGDISLPDPDEFSCRLELYFDIELNSELIHQELQLSYEGAMPIEFQWQTYEAEIEDDITDGNDDDNTIRSDTDGSEGGDNPE